MMRISNDLTALCFNLQSERTFSPSKSSINAVEPVEDVHRVSRRSILLPFPSILAAVFLHRGSHVSAFTLLLSYRLCNYVASPFPAFSLEDFDTERSGYCDSFRYWSGSGFQIDHLHVEVLAIHKWASGSDSVSILHARRAQTGSIMKRSGAPLHA
ncbi:hypothetical protein BC827DRAFT_394340 [Russula dissimulans]|nr:hypothetical protein BC827DRAFT_394340 [Russula dissimulans]